MTARDAARNRWICCITVAFRHKLQGLLVFLCLRLLESWLSKGLWLQTFGQLLSLRITSLVRVSSSSISILKIIFICSLSVSSVDLSKYFFGSIILRSLSSYSLYKSTILFSLLRYSEVIPSFFASMPYILIASSIFCRFSSA